MIFRILFLSLLLSTFSFGQTESEITDLDIRIMPAKIDKTLPYSVQPKLEQKVIGIFTQNDVVNKKESTFVVYPMLEVMEYGTLEGISTEVSVQLQLGLLVKNIFSDQYILIFSHKLSGSGRTQQAAVNRAVNSIRPQRKAYQDFINDLQEKVSNYYEQECSSIIADAQRAVQNNEYQKAISLLYVLPKKSDCRKDNQAILDQAYTQYQTQNCQGLIQKAEVDVLKKNYKDAINTIGKVDPNSPCSDLAEKLLEKVTAKVDEQTAKKMDFLNKVYKDNVEIEKAKQQAMKSISNTYIEGIKKD